MAESGAAAGRDHAICPVTVVGGVAKYDLAAHRPADDRDVLQAQLLDESLQVVGEYVVVVVAPGFVGCAVSA